MVPVMIRRLIIRTGSRCSSPQVVSLTHFTVTSGNDTPGRDPINWAIQGSADGNTYTDIYHYNEGTTIWTERAQVIKFTLPSPCHRL